MTKENRLAVDKLLRGISTDHVETVRDAWREILEGGPAYVPQIEVKLRSSAWVENPRGPLSKYFGVLLALLDELDKSVFRKEVTRLRRSKLHPMHSKTLDVLSQRISEQPSVYLSDGAPVFVASDIFDQTVVVRKIEKWSMTRGLSLKSVTRIDVIASRPELAYLGLYNLFLSGIVLTWPSSSSRGLRLWWSSLKAEVTFYHEVGHHVCGHIEGGQVDEQEKEANDYARLMIRRSRPLLTLIGRLLFWPFKSLLKRVTNTASRNTVGDA